MKAFFYTSPNILGINERNLSYVKKYNSRKAKKIADDKLLTKRILRENGIETPELIKEVKSFEALNKLNFNKLPGSMVVKPKQGFGGEGIIVFFSHDKDNNWVKADKTRYSQKDLKNHISGILEGNFSLKNTPDSAFFEERVLMHPDFKKYSYRGIPDIRIIVFNKVPVMAMLRLPTKESEGKANLHAGGIGVGIDIATGITTTAVYKDKYIDKHPDSGLGLRGIKIPFWDKVLNIAVSTQICTDLGFLGVDIVIDKVKGPLVLELNARPGLSIQIANNEGLKGRLERVKGLKIATVKRGVQVGKDLFGGEVEEEIEELSGKQLVGRVEYINMIKPDGTNLILKSRNDSGALWSSIDESIALEMGFGNELEQIEEFKRQNPFNDYKEGKRVKLLAQRVFEDNPKILNIALVKQAKGFDLRPIIKLKFKMSGIEQEAGFTVTKRSDMLYKAIIGRRALKYFLIDPSRKFLGDKGHL
jgi:alpha-L-glutamate ligase-like protein